MVRTKGERKRPRRDPRPFLIHLVAGSAIFKILKLVRASTAVACGLADENCEPADSICEAADGICKAANGICGLADGSCGLADET
jgi:hypothetical protein